MTPNSEFDYLLDKIAIAEMRSDPFRHVWIEELFTPDHFAAITAAPEINVSAATDEAVLAALYAQGFQVIDFPGCATDPQAYLRWHRGVRSQQVRHHTACEGFGLALRLTAPRSPLLVALDAFLKGERFQAALADKFGIDRADTFNDSGIQKYLDGYEISPHPDVRRKALTYMVNINPAPDAHAQQHHTQYLRFAPPYRYVPAFWEGHPEAERCWVPWDWCETVSEQRANNSLVAFSPDNTTMHGVKAQYDHGPAQRTQLYGNLWYRHTAPLTKPEWEDFVIRAGTAHPVSIAARKTHTARLLKALGKAFGRPRQPDATVIRDRPQDGQR